MSRLIKLPHTNGMIDYKGEDDRLFTIDRHYSESGFLVFEYRGELGEEVWETFTPPVPVQQFRTEVTGTELVGLFDNIDPTIWTDVENSDNAEAIKFKEAVGRSASRRISLAHPLITNAFAKMVLGNIATQAQVDQVSLGVLE